MGKMKSAVLGAPQRAGWGAMAGWKLNRRQQDDVATQTYKHIFKNPVAWIKKVESFSTLMCLKPCLFPVSF